MLRFLIRGAAGAGCISLISFVLTLFGIVLPIGLNAVTFLSCAFLGFPGILLVYGLYFIQMYV